MSVRHEAQSDAVRIYVESPWTWQEYDEVIKACQSYCREVKFLTSVLIDLTNMNSLPDRTSVVQLLSHGPKSAPNNVFVCAISGASARAHFIIKAFMLLRPRTRSILLFADTIDDARGKIMLRYREYML